MSLVETIAKDMPEKKEYIVLDRYDVIVIWEKERILNPIAQLVRFKRKTFCMSEKKSKNILLIVKRF